MPKKVRKKSAFTNKSAKKSAFTNKSAKKSTLKSTFGSSASLCLWMLVSELEDNLPSGPVGALVPGEGGEDTGVVQKLSCFPVFHFSSAFLPGIQHGQS